MRTLSPEEKHALMIPCPYCGVGIGHPCMTGGAGAQRVAPRTHKDRIRLSKAIGTPASIGRSEAQRDCLYALCADHGSPVRWNTTADRDVICEFRDGAIMRVGVDGHHSATDILTLAADTDAEAKAITALTKRNGPLTAFVRLATLSLLVQFQSGRTFRMARDGSHIPAPPSPLLTEARRQHDTSERSPLR
jgi:hypothetical protein